MSKSMPSRPQLPTLDELRKLYPEARDVNAEHDRTMSGAEKFAISIARRVGTPGFFTLVVLWTVGWAFWNLRAAGAPFDPPPTFEFWVYLSNVLQIFLMPLLLIASNLQARHAERRADIQYEINQRAQQELEVVLQHQEHQNAILAAILEKLEGSTPDAQALARAGASVIDQQRATLEKLSAQLTANHQQATGTG
jgi:uncharacterized membrane protein